MYRFRVDDGGKLVLQIATDRGGYNYGVPSEPKWRDAKVEDIPVADPFRSGSGIQVSYGGLSDGGVG